MEEIRQVEDLPLRTILEQKFRFSNSSVAQVGTAKQDNPGEACSKQTHARRLEYGVKEKLERASRAGKGNQGMSSVIAQALSPKSRRKELKYQRQSQLQAVNALGGFLVEMAKVLNQDGASSRSTRRRRARESATAQQRKRRRRNHRVPKHDDTSDNSSDSNRSSSQSSSSS